MGASLLAMPDMDMPGMNDSSSVTGLNWLCTIGFAVAALFWLYLYFTKRDRRFGITCQAMMAVGTAIMFSLML
jgi:hypothetical protein